MTEIPVHSTLGLNPRRCVCGACGRDTDQIRNLGAFNHLHACRACGLDNFGRTDDSKCNRCDTPLSQSFRRELRDDEKVSGPLCPECQTESNLALRMVEAGGIFCVCQCLNIFALPPEDPLSIRTRNLHDCPKPQICRLAVDRCPKCRAKTLTNPL